MDFIFKFFLVLIFFYFPTVTYGRDLNLHQDFVREFRNTFFQILPNKEYQKNWDKILMPFDKNLLSLNEMTSVKDVENLYRQIIPYSIYESGLKSNPFELPVFSSLNQTLARLRNETKVTFIIIPGIFSELINTRFLEEVFSNEESIGSKKWKKIFKSVCSDDNESDECNDESFNLNALSNLKVNLNKLVNISSIDYKKNAKIDFVLLRPPKLSLETFNDVHYVADAYIRRLDKVFNIMGVPDNIVFVGYSKGVNIALEMLIKKQPPYYYENVKGVLSWAGTIFGSYLADIARYPEYNSNNYFILKLLEELTANLKVCDVEDSVSFEYNNKLWKDFFIQIRRILKITEADPEISFRDIWATLKMLNFSVVADTVAEFAFRTIKVQDKKEYKNNILKFKYLIKSSVAAIDELTTVSREQWWFVNQEKLPRSITYYSLSSLMPYHKKYSELNNDNPMVADNINYVLSSPDLVFNSLSYVTYTDLIGLKLNDGEVSLERTIFWPQLTIPYKIQSIQLGILGTHHWGKAFIQVFNDNNHLDKFPRKELFIAFAKVFNDSL